MRDHKAPHERHAELTFKTKQACWVIPCQCELVKLLIEHQKLEADALQFDTSSQCHEFIRQLFLLALEDEVKNYRPSSLANFARHTLVHHSKTETHC